MTSDIQDNTCIKILHPLRTSNKYVKKLTSITFVGLPRGVSDDLWKCHPNFQLLLEIGRSEACNRIPPIHCIETICTTSRISTFNYIVQSPRVSIQYWIDETYWAFASFDTLLVDQYVLGLLKIRQTNSWHSRISAFAG